MAAVSQSRRLYLQYQRLFAPKTLRDPHAFLVVEDNAVKLSVNRVILIKCTGILRDDIKLLPERGERAAIDGVRMRCAEYVRARVMDRGVDKERGGVEQSHWPGLIEDVTGVVDEDEVGRLDEREVQALVMVSRLIVLFTTTRDKGGGAQMG